MHFFVVATLRRNEKSGFSNFEKASCALFNLVSFESEFSHHFLRQNKVFHNHI